MRKIVFLDNRPCVRSRGTCACVCAVWIGSARIHHNDGAAAAVAAAGGTPWSSRANRLIVFYFAICLCWLPLLLRASSLVHFRVPDGKMSILGEMSWTIGSGTGPGRCTGRNDLFMLHSLLPLDCLRRFCGNDFVVLTMAKSISILSVAERRRKRRVGTHFPHTAHRIRRLVDLIERRNCWCSVRRTHTAGDWRALSLALSLFLS